ncbi:MAG: SDR family oxidoreductase [Acidimicrobiia bacterium]|nr:SDR family oxidoreductase [Acidimicrobiia bacterium]
MGPEPGEVLAQFDVSGRSAIVTGASSGLGARFARVLAGAGANVYAAARRITLLEEVAADEPRIRPVTCDVIEDGDLQRLVAAATEETGRVDILVNNAGVTVNTRAERETPEEFEHAVRVNLVAVHRLAQLCGVVMLEQGSGVIVNIASMYGLVGRGDIPIGASYPATKGAVVNLTRELAAQWGRKGVRVNALAPGYFPSEMTENGTDDPRFVERLQRRSPLRRMGYAHELDAALLFLCSDASSYVTGVTLPVDGGWTAV